MDINKFYFTSVPRWSQYYNTIMFLLTLYHNLSLDRIEIDVRAKAIHKKFSP